MGTRVVGKLDNWGDADLGGNDFMNLEEGSNPVRVVDSPYQFYIHWTKDVTDANRKVRCALDGCPLCQQGERATARWYLVVLNRSDNRPAILEVGQQIFKQILGLSKKTKWGNPRGYDIDIERHKKGSQPLYTVSPEPKEPLTADEKKAIKEFLERMDLKKMIAAPTPNELREKIGLAAVKDGSSVDDSFDDNEDEPESPESSDDGGSDDDDDFDFDS